MSRLKRYGGWALITGASSGLGRAFARVMAAEGIDCVLVGLEGECLEALARELSTEHSVRCRTLEQDLAEDGFLERVEALTVDIPVGILVNNAGVGCGGAFATRDPKRTAQVVKLNCLAPVVLTRAFLPQMLARNAGAIIMVASLQAFISSPFEATYCASKAFDLHFGESLWGELRNTPVDVITVCPAGMKTDFFRADGLFEGDCTRMWKVSASPESVAVLTLKKLGRKPVLAPNVAGLVGFLARLLPRRWAIHVVRFVTQRLVHYEQF
jgi:short-subunit dehydrogenase